LPVEVKIVYRSKMAIKPSPTFIIRGGRAKD